MTISFTASLCSRTSGKGVVAMAAYRNGKKFKDEMRGRTFDYSQKCQEHRIHSEILAPEHAPEWMTESGTLWNGVQQFETNLILKRYSGTQKDPEARAKSLLGRKKALASNQDAASFIVDLPKELTAEQNIEFLRSYLQDRFVSQGLVVDYSIHAASGNWHAHFAVTLRPLIESGEFSLKKMTSYRYEQKHKDVFNRENLIESRKQYAVHMNAAFRRYGITKRVSHKSFKDQGIFREATKHEGPFARLLDGDQSKPVSRMGRENQAIKDRNLALYRENPRYFVHDFAHSCTEFTLADVAKEVHKLVNGDEALFQDLYGKVRDNVMAVDIPESAKQVDVLTHKGTSKSVVVYDSDAVIEHLSQVIAAEKSPQNSLDINHSRSNQNQLDQSFTSQDKAQDKTLVSLLLSQKQRDVKNHSSQKNLSGHDCARMVMQDILVNPSLVGDALAKQRIVFRDHDVDAVMTILMNTMGEKSHDSSSDSLTSQEQLQSLKAAYEKAVFDQQPENPSNKTVSKGIKNLWKSFTKSDDNREELSGEPSQPLASSLVSSLPTYDFTDQEAFLTSVSKAVVNHEACVLLREDTRRVHVDDAEHTINSLDKNPRETNRFELVDSRLYTSQTQQDSEQTTLARAKRLSAFDRDLNSENGDQNHFAVTEDVLTKILSTTEDAQGFDYLPEQKEAIHTLLSAGRFKILKGRAGTGKTTILNPVVKALQAEGYDVKGMAFQGVVADSLANDLDIHSKNIDQYSHAWRTYDDAFQKKRDIGNSYTTKGGKTYKSPLRVRYEKICETYKDDVLTSKSVVIIDEGSMISHGHYELVLSRIEATGAKCILVKDDAQMKAIQGADIALALDHCCDRNLDMATLNHVVRQKEAWMQNASEAFNDHDVLSGLYEYAERDAIHFGETRDQALDHMVKQFCESYEYQRQSEGYQNPSIVALAYTNADIKALNQGIFRDLQERGLLPQETFTLNGNPSPNNTFAIGARVMFTDNDNTERHVKTVFDPSTSISSSKKGVKNGKMGTLHAYNPETGLVHVKLDGGRIVEFSSSGQKGGFSKPSKKCPITLAYALSTMKSQGKTFDEALVYLGAYDSVNTTLVGCTRHKRYLQIVTSQDISAFDEVTNFRELSRVINRDTNRFVTTDYSISESDHPYFEKIQAYREAVIDRASLLHSLQNHHKNYENLHGDISQWTPEIKERFDEQKEALNATRYVVETAQKTAAEDLFLNWYRCAVLAKQCGLKKDIVAKHAGHHQELFTHRERQRLDTIASYFDVCQKIGEVREAMGMDMPLSLQESHESYGLYEELIQHRTQVAYEITRSPQAYESLMETKAVYGEDNQPLHYELVDGRTYEKKPPSYRTCETHARYLDSPTLVFDISNPEQRERAQHQSELFDAVMAYQKANRRYGLSYYELKSNPQCLENPQIKRAFYKQKNQQHQIRNEKAHEILRVLGRLSYEDSVVILEHCQLSERDVEKIDTFARAHEIYKQKIEQKERYQKERQTQKQTETPLYGDNQKKDQKITIENGSVTSHSASYKRFVPYDRQDINRLAEKVNAAIDAETLAKDLLRSRGLNQKQSTNYKLRFGKKGSFLVTCEGSHANTWHDFETGEGGDLLNLIQREQRLDFKESLAYAANYCRGGIRSEIDKYLDGHDINRSVVDSLPETSPEKTAGQSDLEQKQQKIADIKALVQKSVPIINTPAETYLRRERHIQGALPESLRYVPAETQYTYDGKSKYIKEGALISLAKSPVNSLAKSPNNEIQAVQITYLTADGKRARNKDGNKFTKITYGSSKGAYVTLQQGDKDQPFIIAEGVETALSIKEAGVKGTVVCSLGIGNYKNIIHDQKDVVIAADWDGSTEMVTYKAAEKAKQQVEEQDGKAHIILPVSSTKETKDKTDFNDVLQTKGVAYVKELVKNQCHHIHNEYEHSYEHSHDIILKEAHDHAQGDIKSDSYKETQRNHEREQHALTIPQPDSGSQSRINDPTEYIVSGNQGQTESPQLHHSTRATKTPHDITKGEGQPLEKTPHQELNPETDKISLDQESQDQKYRDQTSVSDNNDDQNYLKKSFSEMTPEERSKIILGGGLSEWAKHHQDKTINDVTTKECSLYSSEKLAAKEQTEAKNPIRTFSEMTPEERSKIILGGGLKEWGKQYETKPKSKDKNKDRGFGR